MQRQQEGQDEGPGHTQALAPEGRACGCQRQRDRMTAKDSGIWEASIRSARELTERGMTEKNRGFKMMQKNRGGGENIAGNDV